MSLSDDFSDLPPSHLQLAGLAGWPGADLGLPDGPVLLGDLRAWMLEHPDQHAALDVIWRELISLARRLGGAWLLAAIGMALPWLVKHAGGLARDVEATAPHRPYGHVDLLRARAVALELIDPDEADLIIDTGLEYLPIEEVADHTGTDVDTLRRRRERAGQRLAGGLAAGHLSGPVSAAV